MNTTSRPTRPTIDESQPTHRPDPYMLDGYSFCFRCGDDLEQTGRGNGYTHLHSWFNPNGRKSGVLPPSQIGRNR